MASAVRADETKLVPLNTALSSTTISGYVDVAAQYTMGDPSGKDGATAANQPSSILNGAGKVDNFTVNDVDITLDKPLDESPWAAGYHVDLNWGVAGDVGAWGVGALRQGYVALRTPVGNGIDWKVGLFDGITGYEVNTSYLNPNYTRSYGYFLNPPSQAGALATYKIVDAVAVTAGMADRAYGGSSVGLSSHDYIGAIALTAPDSFGFLKGSVLNFSTTQTFDNGGNNNYSVWTTFYTPVTGLSFGLAFDYLDTLQAGNANTTVYGAYACFKPTDKLIFNLRGEFMTADAGTGIGGQAEEVTTTVEYDLWANVVSRLEFRWDHVEHGVAFNNGSGDGLTPSVGDTFMLALNLVYKF